MSHRSALLAAPLHFLPLAAAGQSLEAWDENADSTLDADEMAAALEESGAFDEWDADGDDALGEEEFADGL